MKGTNVLVYGATGGIGRAICCELKNRGAEIFLLGRSPKKTKRLVKELDLKPSQAFRVDSITSAADYPKALRWLESLNRRFSVGIHSAGTAIIKKAAKLEVNDWHEVIDVNLISAFAFFRLIREVSSSAGYELVYFGSAAVNQIWPKNALYGASKAGLELFAKTLQKEVRQEGGRVWLYKPGSVRTDFFNNIENHMPPEKMISPEELAKIVVGNFKIDPKIYCPEIPILSE